MSNMLIVKNLNLKNLNKSSVLKELELSDNNATVESVLSRLAADLALDAGKIELVYRGDTLDRQSLIRETVQSSNRKTLVLLAERTTEPVTTGDKPSAQELQSIANHVTKIYKSKTRRTILEKLLRNTNELLRVLKPNPALTADPVALSFVQNFDLIKLFADPAKSENFSQNANIYRGVKLIVDFVREKSRNPDQATSQFVSKASYSIDDMSEDEDERSASNNMPRTSQQQQANRPVLTQDYLASILASIGSGAPRNPPTGASVQPTATPATATPTASSNPVATPIVPSNPSQQRSGISMEFFQNVMQQILPPQQANPSRPVAQQTPQPSQQTSTDSQQASLSDADLAAKLEQMHELGLFDDEINVRALQMTGGNVEAAVSLVLEGSFE